MKPGLSHADFLREPILQIRWGNQFVGMDTRVENTLTERESKKPR